jgi:hypothetical protein
MIREGDSRIRLCIFSVHLSLLLVLLELLELLELLLCLPGSGQQTGRANPSDWDRRLVPGASGDYQSAGGKSG